MGHGVTDGIHLLVDFCKVGPPGVVTIPAALHDSLETFWHFPAKYNKKNQTWLCQADFNSEWPSKGLPSGTLDPSRLACLGISGEGGAQHDTEHTKPLPGRHLPVCLINLRRSGNAHCTKWQYTCRVRNSGTLLLAHQCEHDWQTLGWWCQRIDKVKGQAWDNLATQVTGEEG